jgi:methylphosphotriester-DNA--protein-cysteine methyltransferase
MKLFYILLLFLQTVYAQQLQQQEFPKEQLQKQKNEIARMVAQEIAKNLPQRIDNYTTLQNVTHKNATLMYIFSIQHGAKSDEAIQKEDHSRMQRAVTKGVCQSSSKFLEAGINTTYKYISAQTQKLLFMFEITQEKCLHLNR